MKTFLCASFVILAITAQAADKKTEDLLAKMRGSYLNVRTASLKTNVTLTQGKGPTNELTIDMDYMRLNKVRATVGVMGNRLDVYCDGTKILALTPSGDRTNSGFTVDALSKNLPGNLETISFFDWKRQLSTAVGANMHESILKILPNESWNGRSWIILSESAPKQKLLVKYYIDPATNLIWRTIVKRTDTKITVQDAQVIKLALGVAIDPKRFQIPK